MITPFQMLLQCLHLLTDFYNIWHRVYWDDMQHKSYWFAHLNYLMLLHYFGKNQLLVLIISDPVWSGQALGEVCHRLVDVFLWQFFPDRLQSDFQLINCLGLQLKCMVLFQHGDPDVIVQWVQTWRAWGPMILSNEPRTVHLQPVLSDARHVSWSAVLMEDEALTACVAANGGHFEHLQ